MPRYVDKEKVIERINYLCEVCSEPPMDKADEIRLNLLRKLENDFNKLPTADVQEVKHGKWNINCDGYYPYCSECGYEPERPCFHKDNRTPYCPNCGAKMHSEVESTTYCTDKQNKLVHCEGCHEKCKFDKFK